MIVLASAIRGEGASIDDYVLRVREKVMMLGRGESKSYFVLK